MCLYYRYKLKFQIKGSTHNSVFCHDFLPPKKKIFQKNPKISSLGAPLKTEIPDSAFKRSKTTEHEMRISMARIMVSSWIYFLYIPCELPTVAVFWFGPKNLFQNFGKLADISFLPFWRNGAKYVKFVILFKN